MEQKPIASAEVYFNPRSPHGERLVITRLMPYSVDFNPRSPHGERPEPTVVEKCVQNFNPRSPHGERPGRRCFAFPRICISIHAPRTGSDGWHSTTKSRGLLFQSTLPARGATCSAPDSCTPASYFNPRSPHGERHLLLRVALKRRLISIHAPRTGSDKPCGCHIHVGQAISIHAPRTGSDRTTST